MKATSRRFNADYFCVVKEVTVFSKILLANIGIGVVIFYLVLHGLKG